MTHDSSSKPRPRGWRDRHADHTATVAVIFGPKRTRPKTLGDRLGELFLAWAWHTGHRDWKRAVRTLARTLKGLEGECLIERQRVRGEGGETLHLVRLTELGRWALSLAGGEVPGESEPGEGAGGGARDARGGRQASRRPWPTDG